MYQNSIHKFIFFVAIFALGLGTAKAQTAQWRLVKTGYSTADPDGAGPATGSAQFQLQLRAVGSSFTATDISTGFSWQSTRAMLPTGVNCASSSPTNIAVSSAFAAASYQYTTVNQCNAVTFSTGGQTFDRIASGSLDPGGNSITITTDWTPVFTVTLWALGNSNPEAGYVAIHSSLLGSPGPLGSYAIADNNGNEVNVSSLTFATPLPLGSAAILPVQLTKFEASCQANRTVSVSWSTASELNNGWFEVEKSKDGVNWKAVSRVDASSPNSTVAKNYEINDAEGGAAQYRLKQTDRDGKITYSSTVRTTCEGRNVYVSLFPVPAKDVVNLVVGIDKSVKTNLQVFDNKGRLVINQPAVLTNGRNNVRIDVQQLPAGEYILKGSDPSIEISKRFTILR